MPINDGRIASTSCDIDNSPRSRPSWTPTHSSNVPINSDLLRIAAPNLISDPYFVLPWNNSSWNLENNFSIRHIWWSYHYNLSRYWVGQGHISKIVAICQISACYGDCFGLWTWNRHRSWWQIGYAWWIGLVHITELAHPCAVVQD